MSGRVVRRVNSKLNVELTVQERCPVLAVLQVIIGLASLVCFIIVVFNMFQHDDSTLGIVCIVLFFCAGIGALIAFVMGWVNSGKYGIMNIMLAWTGIVVLGLIVNVAGAVLGG